MAADQNDKQQPAGAVAIAEMATHRSPDYRSIYVNNTKFSSNGFDFSFLFGEITESEEGKLYVDQKLKIIMSPLHTKIFLVVLAQNVKNFEDRFGEIQVPGGAVPTENTEPIIESRVSKEALPLSTPPEK